jgi:hypothetical protein
MATWLSTNERVEDGVLRQEGLEEEQAQSEKEWKAPGCTAADKKSLLAFALAASRK